MMHVITCCRSSILFFMEMLAQFCYCSPSDQRRSSSYDNMEQLPHLPVEENTIPIEF